MRVLFTLSVSFVAYAAYAVDFGNIMMLGDSNTAQAGFENGYFASTGLMHNRLAGGGDTGVFVGPKRHMAYQSGSGLEHHHAGQSGWRVADLVYGRASSPGDGKLQDWLVDYQPDTVVFWAGGNDWADFRNGNYTSEAQRLAAKAEMRVRFSDLLDVVFASNPGTNLFWGSYVKSSNSSFYSSGQAHFYSMIEELVLEMAPEQRAMGRFVHEVPLFELLGNDPAQYLRDGVHLNKAGANLVADVFYAEMKAVPEPATLVVVSALALLVRKRRFSQPSI